MAHDHNYSGHRYGVPALGDPSGGINPHSPPQPDPANAHVVRFSAHGIGILTTEVLGYTGAALYRFGSEDTHHLQMIDAGDSELALYENGRVRFGTEDEIKVTKFIEYGRHGSTGAVLTHSEQTYEWLEEAFYGIVRTTPGNERIAIVYNHPGSKPAVEMVGAGVQIPGLQAHIVFATALIESEVMKRRKGRISNAVRSAVLGKKA